MGKLQFGGCSVVGRSPQEDIEAAKMAVQNLELDDGRSLAYVRLPGRNPGVVFLSGFGSDMDGTKALELEDWARRRNQAFLRFDYTGHGQSSGSFEDGCISDWSKDAADAILHLTEGPQLLAGSSMGGWIALLLSVRIPERVCGVVGIAAAPDFTEDFRETRMSRDQLAAMERDGRIEIPGDHPDRPLMVTKKLIEDGKSNLVLETSLNLPFPIRLLQGTEDTDVAPERANQAPESCLLLGYDVGPDQRRRPSAVQSGVP